MIGACTNKRHNLQCLTSCGSAEKKFNYFETKLQSYFFTRIHLIPILKSWQRLNFSKKFDPWIKFYEKILRSKNFGRTLTWTGTWIDLETLWCKKGCEKLKDFKHRWFVDCNFCFFYQIFFLLISEKQLLPWISLNINVARILKSLQNDSPSKSRIIHSFTHLAWICVPVPLFSRLDCRTGSWDQIIQ